MASNFFGTLFRIATWGESHGKAIGVVIDGCPAGLSLSAEDINQELAKRAPGKNSYTSPRVEPDLAEIYSGVFSGQTTGAPISIIIANQDADSSKYETMQNILRPGHANYTYIEKYGVFDFRGGGRASARETACRVAAGAVAKKLLAHFSISTCAYLASVGEIACQNVTDDITELKRTLANSSIFCPDPAIESAMLSKISESKNKGDSLGGIIHFITSHLPVGLGDPVYEKIEANLAKAMLSIPASKAFQIGEGFSASCMSGSTHNDAFTVENGHHISLASNHAGGTLGGISTGFPIYGQVAFKPTSSIKLPQATTTLSGEPTIFRLPEGSRHDPCVAIRAVPVVEAMLALVLADAILMNRAARL